MTLSRYQSYKATGLDWLGDIPEHWNVTRTKVVANPIDLPTKVDSEQPVPYIGMANIESWTGKLSPADETTPNGIVNRFKVGQTLFGKLRPYLAKAWNPTFNGLCSTEFIVLESTMIDHRFLLYLLLSDGFIQVVDSSTYGSKMPRASWDFIGNCRLPVAFPDEQDSIVQFLDRRATCIDALMSKLKTLVQLMNERRDALITHTITSSNSPKADSKTCANYDQGTHDWSNGEMLRLKYVATMNDEVLSETTDPNFEISYVDIGSVDPIRGVVSSESMSFESAPSRARRIVRDGDTIVSTVRTYLRAIVQIKKPAIGTIVSTGFAVIRPQNILADFLGYTLISSRFVEDVMSRSVGVSYPAINASEVGRVKIRVPSESEQRSVSDFLNQEISQIDKTIATISTLIDRLREYHTALVTAAVTGAIDVRGVGSIVPSEQIDDTHVADRQEQSIASDSATTGHSNGLGYQSLRRDSAGRDP